MGRSLLALLSCALLVIAAPTVQALDKPKGSIVLTLTGAVAEKNAGNEVQLDMAMIDALPVRKMTVPTPWYKEAQTFEGPLFRDVLKLAGAYGKKLYVVALNDYAAEIPLSDLTSHDVILANKINGKRLTVRDKGPLFVMYPFDKKRLCCIKHKQDEFPLTPDATSPRAPLPAGQAG